MRPSGFDMSRPDLERGLAIVIGINTWLWRCVLFFEPGLVERLLDDVDQMPGALPTTRGAAVARWRASGPGDVNSPAKPPARHTVVRSRHPS